MKEKVKKDENQPATTSLAMNLEQDMEQNMIELSGEVVTRPSFYQIDGKVRLGLSYQLSLWPSH